MGSTSDKVKNAIAWLKSTFLFCDKEKGVEGTHLSFGDEKEIGRILESYEASRVLGTTERFTKPVTVSLLRPGYFRLKDSVWRQKLVAEVPSVEKHEVHYLNAAGYWLALMDVAQKLATDESTDEEGVIRCMGFAVVFGMVARLMLLMRMDYYHLAVTSGAAFAAQNG